ncbi:MAG: S9 family peptidase [Balneolaceae bacterium]|nr:S9 family peptidase [Balneolaceae bacterium]MBO6544874.1 S9 family peptidase [Balneolaceae bacterium]MBO6646270.1 S9 family peptidase [Balneolaceae bacterium]
MRPTNLFYILIATSFVISSCVNNQTVPEIPAELFFKKPKAANIQISPDGNHIAFLSPWKNRLNLFVTDVERRDTTQLSFQTGRDISTYFWINKDELIYVRDNNGDENFYLTVVDKETNNERELLKEEGVKTGIIDILRKDPNNLIIGQNKRDPQIFDPYLLNIKTGNVKLLADNPGFITGWLANHLGSIKLAIANNGVDKTLFYRETDSSSFTPIFETSYDQNLVPLLFTGDNDRIYAKSNIGRDTEAIVIYNLSTNKEEKVLFEHSKYDTDDITYSFSRNTITGIVYKDHKLNVEILDDQTEELFEELRSLIPEENFFIISQSLDEQKMIIQTHSDVNPGVYYYFNNLTGELVLLSESAPWLNQELLSSMKPITYKAKDGLEIDGYLTLPKNRKRNLPAIIIPHGGPWDRDEWGFNSEVQFFANRGYAVLQMNFRGSTGYGTRFLEASFKQWGQSMQEDIDAGAEWLVEKGIANENQIAIHGASYGGYAALMGVINSPQLYQCAVSMSGITDINSWIASFPPYWKPYLEFVHKSVGNPSLPADSVMLARNSPINNITWIERPVMLAHGTKDPRVAKTETDRFVNSLRNAGVQVEYLIKENEGHGFQNEENVIEFYQEAAQFLQSCTDSGK